MVSMDSDIIIKTFLKRLSFQNIIIKTCIVFNRKNRILINFAYLNAVFSGAIYTHEI